VKNLPKNGGFTESCTALERTTNESYKTYSTHTSNKTYRSYFVVGFIGSGWLKLWAGRTASAAWFDDSWQYRKKINIASHTASENNVYVTTPTFDATDTTRFKSGCETLDSRKKMVKSFPTM